MPRVMAHTRLKQRIISDSPSVPLSPESGNSANIHINDKDQDQNPDLNEDADGDMDDGEGGSINILDDGANVENEEDDGDEESNLGHGLTSFNSRKPSSLSQNNVKNTKGLSTAPRPSSVTTFRMADIQQQPSDTPESPSVRRSARVKPSSSSKEPAESRSPAKRPLKIKLRLGSKPTPELEDENPIFPVRSNARKVHRGGRTKGKGKSAAALTFILPARGSEAISSRPSVSPAETSLRTSPESEDDPNAEMDVYHEPGPEMLEVRDVNLNEQDDDNMDENGDDDDDDDDSEVLPDQKNKSRMTSRQAVLASKADPEHVELDLTASSRKKQLTSEEIALRREETARKRKNLNEKKLEDEKTETINRLLKKKQSSRSRAKRFGFNASVAVTPQSHSAGEEGESDHGVPEKPKSMPGPAWKWISSRQGYRLGIPIEMLQGLEPLPLARPPPLAPICDVQGCSQVRKYRMVSEFNRGACGMEHLKLLSNNR